MEIFLCLYIAFALQGGAKYAMMLCIYENPNAAPSTDGRRFDGCAPERRYAAGDI